jgi:ribose-phosphate pyrophosphokinase
LINLIAGNSSGDLAKKISKKLKANLVRSEVKVFPDGESKITLKGKISRRWREQNNSQGKNIKE